MKLQFLKCKQKKRKYVNVTKVKHTYICILTKQINKHRLTLFQTKSYKHANEQPNIQTKQVNKQTNHKKKQKKDKQII